MSGAVEHIMDIERRMDRTGVLANDGSTADLLASALVITRSGLLINTVRIESE